MNRSRKTHYNEKGDPRTKGIRNPIVVAMRGCKGGAMEDKKRKVERREKRNWRHEEW